ncbi:MAG: putative pyridoxal-dependent aspartate 1-decarboxylase, partial [Desulfobacteraceae bacterium]|nr:putative pyridoxal-dependent aspartate 1-decarboxylase [Desulfobacteraceae bacterium]
LNQNVIKLETSKVLSILEKQVLAKIHRMIYGMGDKFYATHVQNTKTALGGFTTGGTTANITALWVARNKLFPQKGNFKGIEAEGFFCAMQAHGLERVVVLVSKRGHFSLKKAGGILGIGHQNVIAVEVDKDRGIDIKALLALIRRLKNEPKTRIAALVGIAGATETGVIDPLPLLADICEENGIHFHVDAAWGGPVLLSDKYAPLLKGIERADSVAIDCHKQFYMPMTAGMVFFKDPLALDQIAYNASYIIRKGSVDLGVRSLEGSRESNSLILDASLKIMGARGYGLLIEHGIKTAGQLAEKINTRPLFELITAPVLNILTYRLVPQSFQEKIKTADPEELKKLNLELDDININIQRIQREAGKSFVSRTRLKVCPADDYNVVVLRVVIMNPMTTPEILDEVLDEQESILNNLDI